MKACIKQKWQRSRMQEIKWISLLNRWRTVLKNLCSKIIKEKETRCNNQSSKASKKPKWKILKD